VCCGDRCGDWYGTFADGKHLLADDAGNMFVQCMGCIYRTKDNGANWEKVAGSGAGTRFYGGALCKDPNGHLYAGNASWKNSKHGMYPVMRSTKSGDSGTWTEFSSGIPSDYICNGIVYNPVDGRLYAICVPTDTSLPRVYRTVEPVSKAVPPAPPASTGANGNK